MMKLLLIIIKPIKSVFNISCKRATELISIRRDSSLNLIQALRLKLHLSICDACTRFDKQLTLLHESLHFHTHNETVSENEQPLPEDIKERMKSEISSRL